MDLCWLSGGLCWMRNSILLQMVQVSTGVVGRKVDVRPKIPLDPDFSVFLADIRPEGVLCPIPVVLDVELDYLSNGITFDSNRAVES